MFEQLMAKEAIKNHATTMVDSPAGKDGISSSHSKAVPQSLLVEIVETTSGTSNRLCKHGRLECPRFDGGDFIGWLMKIEQFS